VSLISCYYTHNASAMHKNMPFSDDKKTQKFSGEGAQHPRSNNPGYPYDSSNQVYWTLHNIFCDVSLKHRAYFCCLTTCALLTHCVVVSDALTTSQLNVCTRALHVLIVQRQRVLRQACDFVSDRLRLRKASVVTGYTYIHTYIHNATAPKKAVK